MNARARWFAVSMLLSALLAGATAWYVTDWTLHRHGQSHAQDRGHVEPDFHAWMHEHLDITPEQHAQLEPIEAEFEAQRVKQRAEIRRVGLEVAEIIRAPDVDEARLKAALARLNEHQGELQRLTLEHFFAMKRHLRAAQAEKLLMWTHDSLTREP